jgi:hypothetical protein
VDSTEHALHAEHNRLRSHITTGEDDHSVTPEAISTRISELHTGLTSLLENFSHSYQTGLFTFLPSQTEYESSLTTHLQHVMALLTDISIGNIINQSVIDAVTNNLWHEGQEMFISLDTYEDLYNKTDPNVKILLKLELRRLRKFVTSGIISEYTPYVADHTPVQQVHQTTKNNFKTTIDNLVISPLDNWHGHDAVTEVTPQINIFINSFEEWISNIPNDINIKTKNELTKYTTRKGTSYSS